MREEKIPDLGRGLGRVRTRAALAVAFTLVLISSLTSTSWGKAQYRSLHRFTSGGRGGSTPFAGLVADLQGNLYGTTAYGGVHDAGTVFELAQDGHGGWNETVLHSFDNTDGYAPQAVLIVDAAGKLYGTTIRGGAHGAGTIFALELDGHRVWKETLLHSFNGSDGVWPAAGVILDPAGNLYGTTYGGGANGRGAVFELTPDDHGGWKETVLYSFNGSDGLWPAASMVFDAAGNLYGTTGFGGPNGNGVVFELAPDGHGGWMESALHSFNYTDGSGPGDLIFDSTGNLYGTTEVGGANGYGAAFELAPDGHGGWNETVLHSFNGSDGYGPRAGLIFDAAGNLYGTTQLGGARGFGTVFELAPNGHGGWKESVLHSFRDRPGACPLGSLIFDSLGHLYGTTFGDGQTTRGSVFEITP